MTSAVWTAISIALPVGMVIGTVATNAVWMRFMRTSKGADQ